MEESKNTDLQADKETEIKTSETEIKTSETKATVEKNLEEVEPEDPIVKDEDIIDNSELERVAQEKLFLENQQLQKELNKKIKEAEEQTLKANRLILTTETKQLLEESNLTSEFSSFVMGKDKESTISNIKSFKKIIEKQIKNAITEQIGSTEPPKNIDNSNIHVNNKKFRNLEMMNNFKKNILEIGR